MPITDVSGLSRGGTNKARPSRGSKTGQQLKSSKKVTSATDTAKDADDDCIVTGTSPPGTVVPPAPLDKCQKSDDTPEPRVTRRTAKEKDKEKKLKIKKEFLERAKIPTTKPSTSKSSQKPGSSKVTRDTTSIPVSSSVSSVPVIPTVSVTTPLLSSKSIPSGGTAPCDTQTVSITGTHVTPKIQKQFGDKSRERVKTSDIPPSRPVTTSTADVVSAIIPSFKPPTSRSTASPSALIPGRIKDDVKQPKRLCSENQPQTSTAVVAPRKTSTPVTDDVKNEGLDSLQQSPVASGSGSGSGSGRQVRGSPELHRQVTRRSPDQDFRVSSTSSPARGQSDWGHSDYRPSRSSRSSSSRRAVSIPVNATYSLRPGNGVAPEMRVYDLSLGAPKIHSK